MGNELLTKIAGILVIIGGINWGLVGIANIDLVELLLGSIPIVQQIVYVLVGISALYLAYAMFLKK